MNNSLTQTARTPLYYGVLVNSIGGKQRIPNWARIVILSTCSCLLLPRGVELQIGTVMIDLPRTLLALFSIMAVNHLISGKVQLHLTFADMLMSLHVAIIAFSALYHEEFNRGLQTAISVLVDMGLAYFVARVAVHNLVCFRYYVRIILIIAVVSSVCGVIEMFTGFAVSCEVLKTFFPKVMYFHVEAAQRFGLTRAAAAFRVSLLFGLYCTIAFAAAVYMKPKSLNMGKWTQRICLALCVLGVGASLSSGSWMALFLCIFCLIYDHITGDFRSKWKMLLAAVGMGLLFLSFVSNRGPFKLLIDLTLDPWTGYVRLAMWECVWSLMRDYWLIGWGWFGDWPRSVDWYMWTSADSLYAVYLIRSGVFSVLTLLGFIIYCWYKLSSFSGRKYVSLVEAKGWILSTICLFITALTVDIFGNLIFATYFLLGAGQTLIGISESISNPKGLYHTTNSVQRPKSA